ncbi:MAG: flavodoxin family protein [Halanaerobiales bacterium]|nr:flavodoxin family protein [Halanaerobiales bacterium]
MKVIAFNSSPSLNKSGTDLILKKFLDGMREAGAEVEQFYIQKLNIKPCLGCFNCWLKTPGQCVQKDDMEIIYPKIKSADIQVYATPVYLNGMNSLMKKVFDRSIPLVEPFFIEREGQYGHPRREGAKQGKMVLVSASGFPGVKTFEPLVLHMKSISKIAGHEFAGALLRPYARILPELKERGFKVDVVYDACETAGYQLITEGQISSNVLKKVCKEFMPLGMFIKFVNTNFQNELDLLNNLTLE